jgi:cell division protein FtsW (lipid II flippase)
MAAQVRAPWFAKTGHGFPVAPVTWQGRFATALYVVLVLLALLVYSDLGLIVFVIFFYTMVFSFVVVLKSDLLDDRNPPE